MSDPEKTPVVPAVPVGDVMVDPPLECGSRHVFDAMFEFGDTCACGAFYILTDGEGRILIQEAPTIRP